jgi:hypothetical protein
MSSDEIIDRLPAFANRSTDSALARLMGRPGFWLPALWIVALLFYLPTYLHSDVSWYLVATERFVNGAHLYRDIIEVNPPLAFYLTAPPVLIAGVTGLPAAMCFVAYVFLLLALSLAVIDRMLRSPSGDASVRGAFLLAAFGALVILPLPVFGQREHLMSILALPYIVLVGHRLMDGRCPRRLAILVGAMAAFGIGLKPHFVIVPALLELYFMVLRRSPLALIRPEPMALLAGLLAYVALVAAVNPEYFSFMLPYALLVYDAYSIPFLDVIAKPEVFTLLLPGCAYLMARHAVVTDRRSDVFALAAIGLFIVYLAQSKGWYYHLLPAVTMMWLAAAQVIIKLWRSEPHREVPRRRVLLVWSAAALAVLAMSPVMRGPFYNPFTDKLLPVVERYATGGAIYAFSSHVWVGFPLVNEARVGWASRFPTQWLLPGARSQLAESAGRDPDKERRLREIERYATNAIITDLEQTPPDLVIIDRDSSYMRLASFDYLTYLAQEPRFTRLWASYVKVGEIPVEINESPLSHVPPRIFDIWCRKSATHSCPALAGPG